MHQRGPGLAQSLTRRQLLTTVGVGVGATAALWLWRTQAAGQREKRQLLHVKGQGPEAWLQQLPASWAARSRPSMERLVADLQTEAVDLAMVGEAWLTRLRPRLQPFGSPELVQPLLKVARDPAVLGGTAAAPMAFPWAFGSWVMVFRNQPAWAERGRREGWSLLAAAELQDVWILPASPRVVMGLVLQSLGQSPNTVNLPLVPGLAARLATVVRRARAFDSRHALTRLVNGHGSAAVVPSWTVVPQLLRDQRLVGVRPAPAPPRPGDGSRFRCGGAVLDRGPPTASRSAACGSAARPVPASPRLAGAGASPPGWSHPQTVVTGQHKGGCPQCSASGRFLPTAAHKSSPAPTGPATHRHPASPWG